MQRARGRVPTRRTKQDGNKVLFKLGISTHRIECNCRWDGKHGYEHGPNSHGQARKKKDDRRAIFTRNHELILAALQLLQISKELKNPRLRPTSVLGEAAREKKKPQGSLIIMGSRRDSKEMVVVVVGGEDDWKGKKEGQTALAFFFFFGIHSCMCEKGEKKRRGVSSPTVLPSMARSLN